MADEHKPLGFEYAEHAFLGDNIVLASAAAPSKFGKGGGSRIDELKKLVEGNESKIKQVVISIGGNDMDLSSAATKIVQSYLRDSGHLVGEISQREDVPEDIRDRTQELTQRLQQTIDSVKEVLNDPKSAKVDFSNLADVFPEVEH
ncbi:hypothetical protein AB0L26_18990 [Streptomyces nondiastaticus]|uniref:hypothetical protein n=1 Tax=Streptomyces nondiastaticus TaxID=3154512 RepID=UPI00344338F2